jgi:hypothetical protein
MRLAAQDGDPVLFIHVPPLDSVPLEQQMRFVCAAISDVARVVLKADGVSVPDDPLLRV